MSIEGHWEKDRYVPEPSVRMFERFIGNVLAYRRCDGCGQILGSNPRRLSVRKQYHPRCCGQRLAMLAPPTNNG